MQLEMQMCTTQGKQKHLAVMAMQVNKLSL
jgi:hypothetical protein